MATILDELAMYAKMRVVEAKQREPLSVVQARADARPDPGEEPVPDITGLLYSEARDLLGAMGLFLRSDSTILADSDTVRVTFQSVSAGESLPHAGCIFSHNICP